MDNKRTSEFFKARKFSFPKAVSFEAPKRQVCGRCGEPVIYRGGIFPFEIDCIPEQHGIKTIHVPHECISYPEESKARALRRDKYLYGKVLK